MARSDSVHPVRPTVERGTEPVAWRFWPVSPKKFSPALYHDVVAFNLHRQITAIGYMNTPMYLEPDNREIFWPDPKRTRKERDISYQFAWQMRRGDIICICRNMRHVIAWGLLLDDLPMFFDEDDPIWRELRPLRDRVWEVQGEWFCNYRRVDRWREISREPDCPGKMLPGMAMPTVASYFEADIKRWLHITDDLTAARRGLPPEVTMPGSYKLAPKLKPSKGVGQGRQTDQGRRDAVEMRAMVLATRYYEKRGYSVEDVSARESYDLECSKANTVRCIEVKGGTLGPSTVILTSREVENARDEECETDLFVVSDIVVEGHGEDAVAKGGNCLLYRLWEPDEDDLEPTEYRYTLPTGGKSVSVMIDEEE